MADRWENSRALLERARQSLAGGVSSPFRAAFPVPLYFRDACGARMVDVDGNSYIDYTLAWGPLILGHRHPAVVEALRAAAEQPHLYGAEHELEYAVSERFQRMVPCAERVAFTSSGSEAVQLALRLARAFTGRSLVLKFEGHYHGWMDSVLLSHHPGAGQVGSLERPNVVLESRGQPASAADNVRVAPWNSLEAVERAFTEELAAVIMEPVLCNSGCLMPQPGYLDAVARLCRERGALLIFDEIITGFRLAPGGAQQFFGITPDLATFGKALGGGLPLSAVAGRREIVEQIAGGGVAFGGTFNGNPISLAAADAALGELERDGGATIARANRSGERLMEGIRTLAREAEVPLEMTGFGAAFALHFTAQGPPRQYRDTLADDRPRLARYLMRALEQGIYLLPDGRVYVSAAHTAEEIDETVAALRRALLSSA
jgi:glutamate-1-semialdehyde 2,1-aminomutase